ncbi:hypothetical protein NSB25_25915 [Acetatifactor muris]|uniref:Uncharacterized protein n=1 Tax=Acetatifactor muris TaxID=879566 RepID=A0A2K4ZP26_9FIRM|nr:hypothetical protein [Acetatifactor muris]MCR2050674.1 hypothetical protein [Acetatifactor muris]SOY32221.1 hypothetical protein AMURIS_04979 [Acetatifactor muris]
MLRNFRINGAKAPDAMHKAKTEMVTGMAVVREDTATDKFVKVTDVETVADILFVDKERVPTGVNAARGDMSDYDPDFVNIKANEMVTIDKFAVDEKFGTDQFVETDFTAETTIDTRVSFKDGKAMKATITSPYKFKGLHNDNGHTLIQIEVSDTAAKNATA